jgi:hypothetical protein
VRPPVIRPGIATRPVARPHFERRGRFAYYNRYRGYPYYRHGYRRYNGWWFPPAAFIGGAIIGGAIAAPPVVVAPEVPAYGLSAEHVEWCQNRWRSYRLPDNSYQPYHGPRRVCVSPYGP